MDIYQPHWREQGLKEPEKALDFLKDYPFSSFPDKAGLRNSTLLAPFDVRQAYAPEIEIRNKNEYLEMVKSFLSDRATDDKASSFLE